MSVYIRANVLKCPLKALLSEHFRPPKSIKSIKSIKSPKEKNKKGYGTRFARVVSKAKDKSKSVIMHSLCSCFFKSKSFNTSLVVTR